MRKIEVNEGSGQHGVDIVITIYHNDSQSSATELTFGETVALYDALGAELKRWNEAYANTVIE